MSLFSASSCYKTLRFCMRIQMVVAICHLLLYGFCVNIDLMWGERRDNIQHKHFTNALNNCTNKSKNWTRMHRDKPFSKCYQPLLPRYSIDKLQYLSILASCVFMQLVCHTFLIRLYDKYWLDHIIKRKLDKMDRTHSHNTTYFPLLSTKFS